MGLIRQPPMAVQAEGVREAPTELVPSAEQEVRLATTEVRVVVAMVAEPQGLPRGQVTLAGTAVIIQGAVVMVRADLRAIHPLQEQAELMAAVEAVVVGALVHRVVVMAVLVVRALNGALPVLAAAVEAVDTQVTLATKAAVMVEMERSMVAGVVEMAVN